MTHTLHRKAFSLVELLVSISIIVLMMAMMAAALSAARASGAKDKTRSSIKPIDEIVQRHFESCESSRLAAAVPPEARGAAIRRLITADMPDNWNEVRHMRDNAATFTSARQRGYVATLNMVNPTDEYADAECLFMIVMQGGLADCLACGALDAIRIGDKDGDGAPEFWDAWDMPIRYVLWPAGFELLIGTKYFSQIAPFDGLPATGGTGGMMRPLIFSGGPSKLSSTAIYDGSYLSLGNACGDPANATIATLGGLPEGDDDHRRDNVTNFDDEVVR